MLLTIILLALGQPVWLVLLVFSVLLEMILVLTAMPLVSDAMALLLLVFPAQSTTNLLELFVYLVELEDTVLEAIILVLIAMHRVVSVTLHQLSVPLVLLIINLQDLDQHV